MLLAHLPPGLTLWFLWHRWYRLELDRREDYEVCKVLIALAMAEEGECWKDEAFRPSELAQWVADWELPKSWGESGVDAEGESGVDPEAGGGETAAEQRGATGAKGPPRVGVLVLRYDSAGFDVKQDLEARKKLQTRLLCGYLPPVESRMRIGPDGQPLAR